MICHLLMTITKLNVSNSTNIIKTKSPVQWLNVANYKKQTATTICNDMVRFNGESNVGNTLSDSTPNSWW